MALPNSPSPPDPPSTTSAATIITTSATTTITTATTVTNSATPPRPLFPPNPRAPPPHLHSNPPHPYQPPFYSSPHHHPHPSNSRHPSNPNLNYPHLVPPPHPHDVGATTTSAPALLYPVASSGRGFLTKQTHPVTAVSLANPNSNSPLYQPRTGFSYSRPGFGYPHSDPALGQGVYVSGRPTHLQHPGVVGNAAGGVMPGVIKGVPVSGASSQSQNKNTVSPNPNSECNGHKDLRERSKDEAAFVTIRDRKVKVSDNASLYTLCRSWLRNGYPEENQLQFVDAVRSLPRPLPLPAQDITSPVKKEDEKEEEEEEGSVENLTPQELLQRHVKHAKRVRSRLREERLRRIARYKTRLALLLPPMVDPQLRNDLASGN